MVIPYEYDTAFVFDKTNQIALVANRNDFNKIVNPLTGEEEISFDYFYIDTKNNKFKLLAEHFPDSMFTFPYQQELKSSYIDSTGYFKILFQNKLYLFSKNGKQLSAGFDNIYTSKTPGFFETENGSEIDKRIVREKGLIDSSGLVIVKCKYHDIKINNEDSSVYCCSAVYNSRQNDDVYDFEGKLIYTNKKHIEFSSKTIHVLKSYKSSESFTIENLLTNDSYEIEGNGFYYLKMNKALIVNNNVWFILDLLTRKRQKVDREEYFKNLLQLLD
ncbi:MAG: hypothetical protein H7141_14385 [Burkholderiales bacterium]|nr:hypothetical protein [Bacteroidia bacterium]